MVERLALSGLANNGPAIELRLLILPTRSPVLRRRSPEPGVVGTSLDDLPRVGVRGGASSGSEADANGGGAASEGSTGVDVCRFSGGVRYWGSLPDVHGFATSEDIMSAVAGRERGVVGSVGVTLMFGVTGRESSSRYDRALAVDERRVLPATSSLVPSSSSV
jgi:hypothetical protein